MALWSLLLIGTAVAEDVPWYAPPPASPATTAPAEAPAAKKPLQPPARRHAAPRPREQVKPVMVPRQGTRPKPVTDLKDDEVIIRGSIPPPSVLQPPPATPPPAKPDTPSPVLATGPAAGPATGTAAKPQEAPLPWYKRFDIHGFADVYFAFNFNRPADGANFTPTWGTSAKRHNEFSLNLATIAINMDPSPVGVRLVIGYGSAMDVIHADEPEPGPKDDAAGVGNDTWRYLVEASVSVKVPVGRGLIISGGMMPGHVGLEVLYTRDNWNYTRSWLGDLPAFFQTGLRLSYPFTDNLSAQLHLLNGWQIVGDTNSAKSLGVQIAWQSDLITAAYNLWAGPEGDSDNKNWLVMNDAYLIWRAHRRLNLALAANLGAAQIPMAGWPLWYAVEGFGQILAHRLVALALRGGFYTNAGGLTGDTAQTVVEGTTTLELRPYDGLSIKLEGRYDHSDHAVFGTSLRLPSGDLVRKQEQWLALIGTVVSF